VSLTLSGRSRSLTDGKGSFLQAKREPEMNQSRYARWGKRLFDLVTVTYGLVFVSPLLMIVGLAVKLSSRGPVFFRQVRVGQSGNPFQIFKFRSMRAGSESGLKVTASGDPRITPLGAWMRRTKIDELPQLFNVILGDMSIVGPRPEVPEFVARYTIEQRSVLNARPGLFAPSAIVQEEELLATQEDKEKFYLTTLMPAKLEIDVLYCENISFREDMQVLFQTLVKLSNRVHVPFTSVEHPQPARFEVRTSKK
jgi:lipopolysaccharide/colanic/teichoic acid biosynthesis glycosyltransferase